MIGKAEVVLLDGYVDEPAMLGVPPYISPLSRYIYGALVELDKRAHYLTIDQVRAGAPVPGADLLVVVKGALVPGKYLRGMPISGRELSSVAQRFPGVRVVCGAGARFSWTDEEFAQYNYVVKRDPDAFAHDLLEGKGPGDRWRTAEERGRWSVLGARLARAHPDFPQPLIAEVETSRGCVRFFSGGCSFCSEPSYGPPQFRPPEEVVAEVAALSSEGVTNFRLGGQACIYSYMAEGIGDTETPTPNPEALKSLLSGVRKVAPELRVLHVDNANPAVIAENLEQSYIVTRLLVKHCTSGNVVAFGMESADPAVIEANNLNATPAQVMDAIKLVNKLGAKIGGNGLPALLPGLNILSGLDGETRGTFKLNLEFLRAVLDSGLMLRRINIRQVAPHVREFDTKRHYADFRGFKERVRREIDLPMLRRVVPELRVLRDVYIEVRIGGSTFGRQVGSYPLLVDFPYKADLNRFVDALIVGHGPKSLRAVETPLNVNEASMGALQVLPGIGRKRAIRIMAKRPYRRFDEFQEALDDPSVVAALRHHLRFP
jgi:radical SAM superfamily enzyme with C-terminal helix-hairpin-helix motif